MDGDIADKIKSFLADPSAAEKISSVMQTLQKPKEQPTSSAVESKPADALQTLMPVLGASNSGGPYLQLITALRPLIREEKRPKLDSMERALTVARLFSGIRKR